MQETEQFSALIGNIYDAALDPDLWPSVLERTCEYVKGMNAVLASYDALQVLGTTTYHFSWGEDPYYRKLYLERYVGMNQGLPLGLHLAVGDVACLSQHAPYEELLASPLYRDWAKPQGIIDTAQTTLQKSGTALAVLAINRHESIGLVDEPMMRKIGMLSPHFRRAVLIGKAIDLHKVEAATLADTLDGLAAGMILVDAQGRILHTNAQGRVLLELGDVVRNTKGMLRAIDPAADTSLQAVFAAAAGGDAAVGVTGIAVPLTSGASERWVAHVLPLTSGARRKASASYSAVAAVFVRKTALDLLSPIQTMTQAYQLTPAEGRVLMAVAAIGGVADVASAIGISEATVKTHLQHLFEKTGTNRQADLIKLIAGFMGPLV